MDVRLFTSLEEVERIIHPWKVLLERSPARDFFLLPEWVFSWWHVFGKSKQPYFVTLWEDQKLRGFFPFSKFRKGPFRVIAFPGYPYPPERMDFLLVPGSEATYIRGFIEWLDSRTDWDICVLRNFGCFSDYPELLDDILKEKEIQHLVIPDEPCYYLNTHDYDGFRDYFKSQMSAKHRQNFRRLSKKVMKRQGASWNCITHIDERLLEEMAELDAERSPRGIEDKSYFSMERNRALINEVIAKIREKDMIRLFTFRSNGRLESYALTFRFDGKLLGYQKTFDRDLWRTSIGSLLMIESIKHAFEANYSEYDFLRGGEIHSNRWTDRYRLTNRVMIYRGSNMSRILHFYHTQIKPVRKKLGENPQLRKVFGRKLKKLDI
jgi:CelD/BcsL family acetyltransferase involved in cellulose biosynthesis